MPVAHTAGHRTSGGVRSLAPRLLPPADPSCVPAVQHLWPHLPVRPGGGGQRGQLGHLAQGL
jgi:hypothetical protein